MCVDVVFLFPVRKPPYCVQKICQKIVCKMSELVYVRKSAKEGNETSVVQRKPAGVQHCYSLVDFLLKWSSPVSGQCSMRRVRDSRPQVPWQSGHGADDSSETKREAVGPLQSGHRSHGFIDHGLIS
jgi:hypothetical protein